jgi:prepilin-type N-terminal cleavage/methylation domain-containing protein
MKNSHKGFSLIELIIVIAIMAILVGVFAPVLFIYLNKSQVSADTQLCSSIQDAIYISMHDQDVATAEDDSKDQIDLICSGNKVALDSLSDCEFVRNVNDIVGYDVCSVNNNRDHFKTKIARENGEIYTQFYNGNYYVWIDGSDASGRDKDVITIADATEIEDGVIYAY